MKTYTITEENLQLIEAIAKALDTELGEPLMAEELRDIIEESRQCGLS